jgi:hypothetical protein
MGVGLEAGGDSNAGRDFGPLLRGERRGKDKGPDECARKNLRKVDVHQSLTFENSLPRYNPTAKVDPQS